MNYSTSKSLQKRDIFTSTTNWLQVDAFKSIEKKIEKFIEFLDQTNILVFVYDPQTSCNFC